VTEEELLAAAAAQNLRLDRPTARALAAEVQRIREAAQRLRELPIDPERAPDGADHGGR
jgi:hypothetical protein